MLTEGLDQWMRLTKNASIPLQELNKTMTDVVAHTMQQNAELISQHFARLSDQFQRLSTVKRPDEFFNLQRECLNEDISAAMDCAQKIVKTSTENMTTVTKFLSPLVADTMTKTEEVITKAQQATNTQTRHGDKDKHR